MGGRALLHNHIYWLASWSGGGKSSQCILFFKREFVVAPFPMCRAARHRCYKQPGQALEVSVINMGAVDKAFSAMVEFEVDDM